MVGDQLFADILAGRLAGLTTIMVDGNSSRGGAVVYKDQARAGKDSSGSLVLGLWTWPQKLRPKTKDLKPTT